MTIKAITATCLATTIFLASNAFAERLTWQYIDARYQQPSDDSTRGLAGELSGYIAKNWVLQTRINRLRLRDGALDLEMSQTRYDLSVGRVFRLGSHVAVLASAGYTRLEYELDIGSFEENTGDDAVNVQIGLRAGIADRLDAEVSIGVLVNDEDSSDPLWNVGLRYRVTPSVSFLIGASGVDSETLDSNDILYELGFRFNLAEN